MREVQARSRGDTARSVARGSRGPLPGNLNVQLESERVGREFSFKAVAIGRRASTIPGRKKQFPMAEVKVPRASGLQSSSEQGT